MKTLATISQRGKTESARVAASIALLDRGWGKAEQKLEAEHVHRYVARVPDKAATTDQWQQQHAPTIQ